MIRTYLFLVLVSISTLYLGAQSTFPKDRHRIGIRNNGSVEEFYDKMTGQKFTPNGFNLIQLIQSPYAYYGISELFHPTLHDKEAVEEDLQQMSALGFNSLRVFIDLCKDTFCIGDIEGGLNSGYIDNLVWFLERAREHEIYVMLTANWIPDAGGYTDGVYEACGDQFDLGNCLLLSEKGVRSYQKYFRDLIRELGERDAPFDIILAYQLRNEAFFELNEPPLNLSSGMVTTANGMTYDMSSEAAKLKMADEGIVYWANQVRNAILDVDTSALVTCGFFAPNSPNPFRGDKPIRLVPFQAVLENAEFDFLDIHAYPGEESLFKHMENYGLLIPVEIPIVMGEYGAFRYVASELYDGAELMDEWQSQVCEYGIDGYYAWTWDPDRTPYSESDEIWGGSEGNAMIAKVLSSVYKQDLCVRLLEELNLAQGKHTNASGVWETFTSDQVVDGNHSDTPWLAGDHPPQWVEVDLGEPSEVAQIELVVETGNKNPQQYTHELYLKGSVTGNDYALAETWSGLRNDHEFLIYSVPDSLSKGIRWVRVRITEAPGWAALHEIRVLRPRPDSLVLSPAPPILLHPLPGEDLINTGSLQLIWTNSSPVDSSWLQIAYDQNFDAPFLDFVQKNSIFNRMILVQDSTYYWRVRQKNEAGWGPWSVKGRFMLKDATGIESTVMFREISLYPNPFQKKLILEPGYNVSISEIEVYNSLGEKVLHRKYIREDNRIILYTEYTGLLIVRIKLDDGSLVLKKVISY